MSKKDEALKTALGELQAGKVGIAMQILREALAEQPAQQALDKMAENARELGLDYEPVWNNLPPNKDVEDALRLKRLSQLAEQPAQYSDIVSDGGMDPRNKFDKPAQQEPAGSVYRYGKDSSGKQWHGIRWTASGLDLPDGTLIYTSPPQQEPVKSGEGASAIVTITLPAQQEPVAVHQYRSPHCSDWYNGVPDHHDGHGPYEVRTLYTSPPAQRTWVGLTEEDENKLLEAVIGSLPIAKNLIRAIEAKLREKNT